MNKIDFSKMTEALRQQASRYPNCLIANCDCNEKKGEWKKGCNCLGHWLMMDKKFGKDNWTLEMYDAEKEKGWPLVT